jgi:protein-tyrosine-phosphatase
MRGIGRRGDAGSKPRDVGLPRVPLSGLGARAAEPPAARKRVLFVCMGNAIRSQMAEAFARAYGSDVLIAESAGLNPAAEMPALTRQILAERNIASDGQFPKGIEVLREPFDVVVNLSGQPLSVPGARVVDWSIPDPRGHSDEFFRDTAAQIERLVMRLILELRPA